MSASFVRNIVRNERRDKFIELYEPWLAKELIYSLYESLHEGIHGLPPNIKKDPPEKPLKYRYPMLKGISEFPAKKKGGKTTRKRTTKSKIYRKKGTYIKRRTYKKKIYKRKN